MNEAYVRNLTMLWDAGAVDWQGYLGPRNCLHLLLTRLPMPYSKIARSQGFVKKYCGSSPGQWAILQLLCSQSKRKIARGTSVKTFYQTKRPTTV